MENIRIGKYNVGPGHRPFIIAEMSANHNQSLERAFDIVDTAAKAGAHALKLQTYTADTMTLDLKSEEFMLRDADSLWKDEPLYDLFKKGYTPWEWHKPIMERAIKRGMACFSTPFDESAVEFLETLDVPAYKIASYEITHLPLIREVSKTGKPLLISTGMATVEEIDETLATARNNGAHDIILLKCTSAYPARASDANVLTIPDMRERFGCQVGLSDHTPGIGVALAAVTLGATVIEKHFTLRRADGGPDAAFSMEPEEFASLVTESDRAWQSLGTPRYGPSPAEKASLQERRSLYISSDMKAGEVLSKSNIKCIRPSYGLPPKYYDAVLGKKILRDAKKGTPLQWDIVEGGEINS